MINIDTCAFVCIVIGLVCYLWGYSSGASFTLNEVNRKLKERIKGK